MNVDEENPYPNIGKKEIKKYIQKHGFQEERIKQFLDAFSVFDRNKDGLISKNELGNVMVALGQKPTLREVEMFIRRADTNNTGSVNFDDFLNLMAKKICPDPEMELRQVFNVFDVDCDGFISAEELQDVLIRLGENMPREKILEMIVEADTNGDGKVDFSDFKHILAAK